jgi:SAM-dependent methyltransferase
MRKPVRDFVELAASTLPLSGPVYEFGALQVFGEPDMEDLRPLFPGKHYVGCDFRAGPGVDQVLDLHAIDLPDASVGTVVTMDTFEHVEYPRRAIDEICRVLKPDGILLLSSVMKFPIHGYPNDYWRFTPEGFRSLLKPFAASFVGSYGDSEDFPQTIVGVGFKKTLANLDAFQDRYDKWEHRNNTICRRLHEQPG